MEKVSPAEKLAGCDARWAPRIVAAFMVPAPDTGDPAAAVDGRRV